MTKKTNIWTKDQLPPIGTEVDAQEDYYKISDASVDHNYMHSQMMDMIYNQLKYANNCAIIYGGKITDGGSGTIDISECYCFSKDTEGNRIPVYIPAQTAVSLPSGWNDNRQLWIIAKGDVKTTGAQRAHYNTLNYYYQVDDTFVGDSDSDDFFVDADPNSTPDTIVCLGSFRMNAAVYAEVTGEETESFKISGYDYIVANQGSFDDVFDGSSLEDVSIFLIKKETPYLLKNNIPMKSNVKILGAGATVNRNGLYKFSTTYKAQTAISSWTGAIFTVTSSTSFSIGDIVHSTEDDAFYSIIAIADSTHITVNKNISGTTSVETLSSCIAGIHIEGWVFDGRGGINGLGGSYTITTDGGAFSIPYCVDSIFKAEVTNSKTSSDGGAYFGDAKTFNLIIANVNNCSAGDDGGGIYEVNYSKITNISRCSCVNDGGGAAYCDYCEISNITDNVASDGGACAECDQCNFNGLFSGNTTGILSNCLNGAGSAFASNSNFLEVFTRRTLGWDAFTISDPAIALIKESFAANWTIRTSAADNDWQAVTYGNGLFVAVATSGAGNRVMTSPDGITWTIRTSAANNNWINITFGNGLFVAVSDSGVGNRVMTSPDGITWTSRTSAADNDWQAVTYGNGLFVAVSGSGSGNRVMTSPDGITWTIRTSAADNTWISITYGNGLFVAVSISGTGNRVMTSPDGITWTTRTSATDNNWRSVTYDNGLFVAVSYTGTGNRVMTSLQMAV